MRKFVRTRPAPPPAPHPAPTSAPPPAAKDSPRYLNGHANGVGGARRDDQHSAISSRYWSESESSRVACGGAGSGAGSGAGGAPLWEDADFPPARAIPPARRGPPVLWLRPHEVCPRPSFLGEEACASDGEPQDETDDQLAARWVVEVGGCGCAGLCVAAGALALTPRLLRRAVPPHSFRHRYTGAFRFNFWVFGEWREVVVDDRLPWRRASGGALAALHSRGALPGDFTLPLLEKAYAKLYGSYRLLRVEGGDAEGGAGALEARALQDLSGGVVQSFSLRLQPRALTFQVLNSAVPRSTLVVATAHAGGGSTGTTSNGLRRGQPYAVTGLARVRGDGAALVRLRAAAGRGAWAGAWAPHSAEWRALLPHDRDLLADRAQHQGDFWMSFADFAQEFSWLQLVHVGPDDWLREPALRAHRPWRAVLARRRWTRGYNAGGPPHCTETTGANPQFHVVVSGEPTRKCHAVVSVTQQYSPAVAAARGAGRCAGRGAGLLAVGFAVYELPAGAAPRRPLQALHTLRALDVTHESRAREVATFFTLPRGQYLVVPHARHKASAGFLLRIYTDEDTHVWEVNEDNMIIRDISTDFMEDAQLLPAEVRAAIVKVLSKTVDEEVDALQLRVLLRGVWRAVLMARPSRELCRALVALHDARMRGRVPRLQLPALLARLAAWRAACAAHGAGDALRLRQLLRAAGVAASNKVLECLVLRYAAKDRIAPDAAAVALARLHLSHERYRALESKVKSNPLSLEEMILMTVYS